MTASTPLDFRNVNSLWGSVLVETLRRLGLRQAVISPGSRSTPLTLALAREPAIESIPVLDERSAAFFALGLAKRSQRPVLLLCTSGTAGANYFPAIIEAQESGVPLLVITADRPPEMRSCSSGQTIDQQKLFGGFVNFYHELAVPEASVERLRYLRQTLVHAWERTGWPMSGPVHLNAPFRDPLPPLADGRTPALKKLLGGEVFFRSVKPMAGAGWSEDLPALPPTSRGLIVLGPAETKYRPAEITALAAMVKRLGWPVLVDTLSGLRGYERQFPGLVTRYDAIVRSAAAGRVLRPEFVLCVGGWPISKPLRAWLEATAPEMLLVSRQPKNLDALHGCTRHVRCDVQTLARRVKSSPGSSGRSYRAAWERAEQAADRALTQALASAGRFEGRVVPVLARSLAAPTALVLANSMPVRDAEYFWPANDARLPIYFNRGANGIDGTLSTALGIAHGQKHTVLLTGDLALLHDSNGFLSGSKLHGCLTVVLINNNGGGIFEHLPVAQFNPPFEKFFATPQSVDFAALCAAHGARHELIRDWAHLENELSAEILGGIRVLEVRTDRKHDAAWRKQAFAAAARAVERAL